MSRDNRIYSKPPMTIQEMISKWEARGLCIEDHDRASHYLKYINYYRLSGYGFLCEEPHENGQRSHRYPAGTTFEHMLSLYIFDRHLRLLVMDAIERIEVAIRTLIINELSLKYETGHWYLKPDLFLPAFDHAQLLKKVKQETGFNAKSGSGRHLGREPFIGHYFESYNDPQLPPSWMLVEVMPLGTWSKVYGNLRISKDRKLIARQLNLPPATLKSWLHSLTYLRNRCAHHAQIYGRKLPFPPAMREGWPALPPHTFSRYIAVIESLLTVISPETQWGCRMQTLIEETPEVTPERLGIHGPTFWNFDL